jgi:hypothetical protein
MAWLLDTNIPSEGRKPRPEPRVTAFYDTQPLNTLYISVVNIAENSLLSALPRVLLI